MITIVSAERNTDDNTFGVRRNCEILLTNLGKLQHRPQVLIGNYTQNVVGTIG